MKLVSLLIFYILHHTPNYSHILQTTPHTEANSYILSSSLPHTRPHSLILPTSLSTYSILLHTLQITPHTPLLSTLLPHTPNITFHSLTLIHTKPKSQFKTHNTTHIHVPNQFKEKETENGRERERGVTIILIASFPFYR